MSLSFFSLAHCHHQSPQQPLQQISRSDGCSVPCRKEMRTDDHLCAAHERRITVRRKGWSWATPLTFPLALITCIFTDQADVCVKTETWHNSRWWQIWAFSQNYSLYQWSSVFIYIKPEKHLKTSCTNKSILNLYKQHSSCKWAESKDSALHYIWLQLQYPMPLNFRTFYLHCAQVHQTCICNDFIIFLTWNK